MTCSSGLHEYRLIEEYSGFSVHELKKVVLIDGDMKREAQMDEGGRFMLPINSEDITVEYKLGSIKTDEVTDVKQQFLECRWCNDVPTLDSLEEMY